jgi:hypothetical protein
MGQTGCPEMSVTNRQYMLRKTFQKSEYLIYTATEVLLLLLLPARPPQPILLRPGFTKTVYVVPLRLKIRPLYGNE